MSDVHKVSREIAANNHGTSVSGLYKNWGSCNSTRLSHICDCKSGYGGTCCQQEPDEWIPSNPCVKGAKCPQNSPSFYCSCPSGWTGKVGEVRKISREITANESSQETLEGGGVAGLGGSKG